MKRKYIILLIMLLNMFMSEKIYADNHWYAQGQLGTNFHATGDTEIPSIFSKPPLTSEPVYQTGYLTGVSLGYRYRPIRIETELSYRHLPMDKINNAIGPNTVTTLANSDTNVTSVFVNGYYDFHFFNHIVPYVGVGTGYVYVKNDIQPNPPIPVGPGLFFTQKQLNYSTWGYQAKIGTAYHLTHAFQINLEYDYFATFNHESTGQTNLGPDSYQTKQKIMDNTLSLGITYYFI